MPADLLRRFPSLLVVLVLAAPVLAQAPAGDQAEQAKRLSKVAAQKIETDIRDAVREAIPLIKKDPSAALAVLEAAQHTAEKDPALEESQRTALKKFILPYLREARAAGGKSDSADTEKPREKETAKPGQQKDDEGSRRVKELQDRLQRTRELLQQKRDLRGDQQRGLAGVARDAENSSIPIDQDVKFPKNWKELVKKRSTSQMTKSEQKLLKALDTVIEANFDNTRFEDVIKYLEEKTGVTILLDKQAMEQQQVTYETTVRFRARKVTMRTVLRRILGDVGLAYFIKDEAIQVTSIDKAKEALTTRVYYIGDLVNKLSLDLGPILNQQQVLDNAKQIVDAIQTTIEPETWSINNGPGKVYFDPLRMVLVVKATAEVHYMLGGGSR